VKNQSYYAVVLMLLVLITVAVWQFFSLVARSESLKEPYVGTTTDEGAFKWSKPASTPK
jgi:hypothetical protein